MELRAKQFIEFAYGDQRKDKAKVLNIISEMDSYDPATDRYKKFREAMDSYEKGKISERDFLELYQSVSSNKSSGYRTLSRNYLALKEDHALVWEGRKPIFASFSDLSITTAWHLRAEASNQRRIIFLHFGKDQLPNKKQQGLLTLLMLAQPEAAGVGILNIQPGTLVTATRLDQSDAEYLKTRAEKFIALSKAVL